MAKPIITTFPHHVTPASDAETGLASGFPPTLSGLIDMGTLTGLPFCLQSRSRTRQKVPAAVTLTPALLCWIQFLCWTQPPSPVQSRDWDTRAGTIELAIPRLRSGSYVPEWQLDRSRRADQALGIEGICKSQVSRMAKVPDAEVEALRTRPRDAGPCTYVRMGALTMKVREGGRVVDASMLITTEVNAEGSRGILGLDLVTYENGADSQRCRTHFSSNLRAKTPTHAWPMVAGMLSSVFEQPDASAVHRHYRRLRAALEGQLPEALALLEAAETDVVTFTAFPIEHGSKIRSNNPQERQNTEIPPSQRRPPHPPRPAQRDPADRRSAGRAERRMGLRTPLQER